MADLCVSQVVALLGLYGLEVKKSVNAKRNIGKTPVLALTDLINEARKT